MCAEPSARLTAVGFAAGGGGRLDLIGLVVRYGRSAQRLAAEPDLRRIDIFAVQQQRFRPPPGTDPR